MTRNDYDRDSTRPGQESGRPGFTAVSEHDAAEASDVALVAGIMIFAIAALGILPLLKP